MSAEEILKQRQYFRKGFEYGLGADGDLDKDKDGKKEIDCSHLVHSMLVGAGYRISYESTAGLEYSKFFDAIQVDDVEPGDLILWRKVHRHVGIVEEISINSNGIPSGRFFGSQSSTGPASAEFGLSPRHKVYWQAKPDKFLRPKPCYYHGPGNTKSTDPIPHAPTKSSPLPKDKLNKAQQTTNAIWDQWGTPSPVDQESDDGYATKMPANMGFFPVGTNLTWHGGIHCLGDSDHSVHCMFDGIVVAARLPEKDSAEPVHGSRNFVLVKHKTPQGELFWSLYMHLLPIPLKDHDAEMLKALPWLYELELCSEGRGESNFRPLPSTGAYFNPPRTILPGERFVLIDEHEADGFHWCHVQSKRDGIKGWVAKTSRIRISPVIHRGDSLRAGEVVRFDHPIQAGACLGFVSSPNLKQSPFVHVEIFSETLLSGGWTAVCDRDEDDVVCDAEGLKQLMNCAEDVQFLEPLTAGLIRETYADQAARARIWARAYQFKSEWSVDWEDALKRYDPEIARRQGPQFNLYRFWSEAESAGCDLPKGGKPYHYQPLVFREVMFGKKETSKQNDGAGASICHCTSENGIQMIMRHEGFRAYPYNDSAGHATIGYGTLLHKGCVTVSDKLKYSKGISQDEARNLLENAVRNFECKLNQAVKVKINQSQFDALMDWVYNLGPGKLRENTCSWLRNLNKSQFDKVPAGIRMWDVAVVNGVKTHIPGLRQRREDEIALFTKEDV